MLSSFGVTAFSTGGQKRYLVVNPFSLASLRQAVIPFLFMVLIASVETFREIHLSSSGMKNLLVWRLGRNLRSVFIFEWEIL